MSNIPEVNLPAEKIAEIGPITLTNSFLAALVVSLILIVLALFVRKKIGIIPSRMQMIFEFIINMFLDSLRVALNNDEKKARKLLPVFLTIFLFLFIANNFSLLPLFSSIITEDKTTLFRTPASHFSLTIALALGVVISSHIMALIISPIRHISNFIRIKPLIKARSIKEFFNALLEIFLGALDIVGEIAKVLSLSGRLFGNIFAGEVMIMIISSLAVFTHYIVPMPFVFLSAFSGLVHAFVFPLLSLQFMAGTIRSVQS